jgi:hypothetical protein
VSSNSTVGKSHKRRGGAHGAVAEESSLEEITETWGLDRGGKGSAATFEATATFFLAMDHDMSLARSSVGPATLVVAKSFVRVHKRILLLT